jgi:hypothetical protein
MKEKKKIIIPCVAWFVIVTFISILLCSCASSAHCNAYGQNTIENGISSENETRS